MAYVVQQIVKTTEEWAEFDQNTQEPLIEKYWLFEEVTDETGTYYKFKISDGIHKFGELPYQLLNGRSAQINENGDMMIFDDVQQKYVNSGVTVSAYHIAVKYENFKGSIQDFAKQFSNFNKYGEQQGGRFTNDGPGWNAFHYPEEFGEEVFVTATVEDKAAFVSVRNITKIGFHYCVYDADGNTVAENVVINYNAVTMSNLNLSRSMARAANLNPFDFDNLEQLFTTNAMEIVENETAFGITKRSSMAAAKYLCYLVELDLYQYHNVASLAADSTAMNIIAASPAARGFVQSSTAAYDAIRLSSMATAKYVMGIVGQPPADFENVGDIFLNENALTCLVNDATAMAAVAGSATAMAAVAGSATAMAAVAGSATAMAAVAGSATAMAAVAGSATAMAAVAGSATAMAAIRRQQMALDTILNSSIAMVEVAKVENAISSFFDDENALICLVSSATAMAAVADSATAMAAVADSATAMAAVADSATAMAAVADSATAMAAVADSATAMAAVADSATAMAAIRGHQAALDRTLNSSLAMTEVAKVSSAVSSFFNDANALHCLVINATAMAAVAGSATAMAAVAGSATAMAAVAGSATAMAAVAGSATAMAAVAGSATAMAAVAGSATAMAAVAGSATAMAAVAGSATAMAAVAGSATAMAAVAGSATAMAAVAGSATAMAAVAGSATAMAAVAGSATAMAAVAGSATAMAAVAGSATAMAAIMENEAAQEVFWNVQYSFGRGLATYANINNSTLIGLQSLSAVAASAVAMSAVAASAVAMSAVAASAVAMSAVAASAVAMSAVAASAVAMSAVAASAVAMSAVAASPVARQACLGSTTARNAFEAKATVVTYSGTSNGGAGWKSRLSSKCLIIKMNYSYNNGTCGIGTYMDGTVNRTWGGGSKFSGNYQSNEGNFHYDDVYGFVETFQTYNSQGDWPALRIYYIPIN